MPQVGLLEVCCQFLHQAPAQSCQEGPRKELQGRDIFGRGPAAEILKL